MQKIIAVDQPSAPPFEMPDRFRTDIAYFMSSPDQADAPKLVEGEYWINPADVERWLQDGVIELVSPLDSLARTEVELTEEQEEWLRWLEKHKIKHIRLV
jgi:hypothetical protein